MPNATINRFMSASRFLCYARLLLCCLPGTVVAQGKPLVTQAVECVRDAKGRDIASRSMQTPVFASNLGFRAYGRVVASRSSEGACKNTSTVYLAEPAGMFRVALQQTPERLPDGTVYDGNGIETIQWSPSGTPLLIEISQWTWGTDSTWNIKYLLLTPGQDGAQELPISAAIASYFAQPCAWWVRSSGWLNDTRIGIQIEPSRHMDEEGVPDPIPSCVKKPTRFSFDVKSGEFLKGR
jgi:hypothetical protein